jgi:CHAD domain-containing protein
MPPTSVVEIERKYDVEEGTALPPLKDLPGVAHVDKPEEHRLEAEYFDTEDLRLTSRQITLRRRTGGSDAGWHLKLPAGAAERHEYHEPLGRDSDGVPEALLSLVRVHVRDSALVVVARLSTRRTVHHLRNKAGDVLADFSDDHVHAETMHPTQGSQHWREWELELIDGHRKMLKSSQDLMAKTGSQPALHGSKLARALASHLKSAQPSSNSPKNSAGAVLLTYLVEQVHALTEQDPRVRLDAHDSVHKMRVATRRMRSVLATYRKLLADGDAVQLLRTELKWLAGVLGEARDAEVMHERLKDMIAKEPAELVMGPVARRVDIELGADYQKAHRQALEALDGQRYFHLIDTLETLLTSPVLTKMGGKPARKVIPKLIRRDVKRLRAAVDEAKNHPAGTGDHPALHEARKDGKRLRYAAEAASSFSPKKAPQLADAAHTITKVLGDHQDSLVTRTVLRRLGAEAFVQGENGFSYGRLHALEEAAALEAESRFHREWKHFPSVSLAK